MPRQLHYVRPAIKESMGITAPKAQNGFVCIAKIQNLRYFLHLLGLFLYQEYWLSNDKGQEKTGCDFLM